MSNHIDDLDNVRWMHAKAHIYTIYRFDTYTMLLIYEQHVHLLGICTKCG